MSNSIDTTVGQQAFEQLELLVKKINISKDAMVDFSKEIRKTNKDLSQIKTPGGLSNNSQANAQIISDMQKQSTEIRNLQTQIIKLNEIRAKSNQKTSEEVVNQRILTTNANRQAQATSTLAGAYRNLSAQVAIASEKYQNLIARGRTAEQTQKQFNNELSRAQKEFRGLQTRVLEADKAVDKWVRTGERSIGFAKNLLGAFGVVGGVTLLATITQDIFKQTKEIQSLDLALQTVTGTSQKFYESQTFLNRIAETYGGNISTLTTTFTQFYASAKDKISGNEIKNIFESITKSAGFLGLSTEKQEKAFLALNQMMSKGTIQAEELRGQLSEALPNSMGIMVKAVQALNPNMKVTEQTIAKMMKDGKLMSSEVLPEFAKQMEIAYGVDQKTRVETLTAAQTRFSNGWTGLVRSFQSGGGIITKVLSSVLNYFTAVIEGYTWFFNTREANMKIKYDDREEKARLEALKQYAGMSKEQAELTAKQMKGFSENQLSLLYKENAELEKKGKIMEANFKKLTAFSSTAEKMELKRKIAENNRSILGNNYGISEVKGAISAADGFIKPNAINQVASSDGSGAASNKSAEDYQKLLFDNAKKELEIELYKQQKIYEDEKNSYKERLEALQQYARIKGEITDLSYNEEVRLAKGNAAKIKGAELDKKLELLKNLEDYTDKREKLEIKLANTIEENGVKQIKTEDMLADARKKATEAMDEKIKKDEEAATALRKLQDATDDYINSFKDGFLANAGLGSLQIFLDGTFQNLLKGADTLGEKFAVTFDAIGEVAQEAFAFINQASQKNFDEEYSRIEEQKNVSIFFANDSAEAKKKIEKDYEAKRKEIAQREAKAKKKAALFNITVDTAQAVVSALAKYDYVSAILFGVIGAAQLAVVSSREIPQYFKGGVHGGGLAMINDAGGSNYVETVVSPDGTAKQYSGRNVVTNLEAGSEIFTPEQWNAKLMQPTFNQMNSQNNGGVTDVQVNKIVSAINNKTEYHQTMDENGIKTWMVSGYNKTQIMNERFSFKSKSV